MVYYQKYITNGVLAMVKLRFTIQFHNRNNKHYGSENFLYQHTNSPSSRSRCTNNSDDVVDHPLLNI